ncbi:MAG TPA: ATP-binding protein [Planctomycetota bacterium]
MKIASYVRDLPFGRKLKGAILLVSLSAILSACSAFFTYQWVSIREVFSRHVEVMTEIVGDQTAAALEFKQVPQAEQILRTLKAEPQIVAAALYDREGRLFASYLRTGVPADKIPARLQGTGRSRDGRDLLVVHPVRSDAEPLGVILLRSDLSDAWRRMVSDVATIFIVLAVATLAALWLSNPLGGLLIRPVARLAEAVDTVAKGQDFSVRVQGPGSGDELGRLLARFNDMLAEIQARDVALGRARADLEVRVEERTRELEEANRELERFSYSVSHDLKAPLRSIDGYNRILLEECAPSLEPRAKDYLERSVAAAGRMGTLIDDFLKLARLARAEVRSRSLDLSAIATDVCAELRERDPGRDVTCAIAPGLRAAGDPALVRVVLENLMGNAWKFTSRNPKARIEFGAREGAFFVRDDGAGFDMAFRDKLFKPFERLHAGQDYAGTGIGLATVRRIVERHGGRVWAEGAVGKGATFYFTLGTGAGR